MRRPELLIPASSLEVLKIAVIYGADAVYIGGEAFGLRAKAKNFSMEEIREGIAFAHAHDVKVYITANILAHNGDLDGVREYFAELREIKPDALIISDPGVYMIAKEVCPEIERHISTQANNTNYGTYRFWYEQGAKRVVSARELSLAEIKEIRANIPDDLEIETFIHGAMCISYSGRCLLSNYFTGRDANQGACTHPCRWKYAVVEEKRPGEYLPVYENERGTYIFNSKDLCMIEHIPDLLNAGIDSYKIEGRMKQAPYAAGVVSYYRKYIDQFLEHKKQKNLSKSDMQDILDLGNRCGFTDGYYHKQNGADMVTFVKPSYAKTNEALQNEIIDRYVNHERKIPARGHLTLHRGQTAAYEITAENHTVCVSGMEVMPAQKKPLSVEDLKARMAKTGDTPFEMETITVDMDENIFLPVGALNQLRREAVDQLIESILASYRRNRNSFALQNEVAENYGAKQDKNGLQGSLDCESDSHVSDAKAVVKEPRCSCLIENRDVLSEILKKEWIRRIYLDFSAYRWNTFPKELREDILCIKENQKEVYFALPRIFRARMSDLFRKYRDELHALPLDGIMVRNYEELALAEELFYTDQVVIDHNLYTYNDRAIQMFHSLAVCENTVPLELNRKEILHRDNTNSAMVVYGYYPLMTTAPCVHANTCGCDKKPGLCYLKDRYRKEFPVKNYCDACYNVVYNSLPVMLFANMKELEKSGMQEFRVDFTVETGSETKAVLDLMEAFVTGRREEYPPEWKDRYTNGHYKRGVE